MAPSPEQQQPWQPRTPSLWNGETSSPLSVFEQSNSIIHSQLNCHDWLFCLNWSFRPTRSQVVFVSCWKINHFYTSKANVKGTSVQRTKFRKHRVSLYKDINQHYCYRAMVFHRTMFFLFHRTMFFFYFIEQRFLLHRAMVFMEEWKYFLVKWKLSLNNMTRTQGWQQVLITEFLVGKLEPAFGQWSVLLDGWGHICWW